MLGYRFRLSGIIRLFLFLIAESHDDLMKIHENPTDMLLLEGLVVGLSINKSKKELYNMSENDCMD